MDFLKVFIITSLRVFLRIFHIVPLKRNTIVFCSYEGKQYSCNPKYLYEYIRNTYGSQYTYVWVMNDRNDMPDKDIIVVKYLSPKHVFYLLTARIVISNYGLTPFIPKRKNQIFVNTWHGSGAYKSQTLEDKYIKNRFLVNNRDYRAQTTDYFLSGCKRYTQVSAESWNVDKKKFIQTGCPRNDLFFAEYTDEKRQMLLSKMNLDPEYSYILYAPTFRGKSFRKHQGVPFTLDFERIIQAAEKKFGKRFKVLFREHLGVVSSNHSDSNVIDVYNYPDIQELLLISDILITDYSSCIWDYSLLKRPGFLYTPDLQDYLRERSFYTPIESWPFEFSENIDGLITLIEKYDEKIGIEKINNHLTTLGSYETGHACEQIVSYLKL